MEELKFIVNLLLVLTAASWNTITLTTPQNLTAGSVYIVSYDTSSAYYWNSATSSFPTSSAISYASFHAATSVVHPSSIYSSTYYIDIGCVFTLNSVSNNPWVDTYLLQLHLSTPSTNQIIRYNGSNWINSTENNTLSLLTDCSISSPSTNQVLTYNGSAWTNHHQV